jgi:hypothetical protein
MVGVECVIELPGTVVPANEPNCGENVSDSGDRRFAARVALITSGDNGIHADWPDTSPAAGLTRAAWRKSSWSSFNGNCVEVAPFGGGLVGVRDTKEEGGGPVLVFTGDAWRSFVRHVKAGDAAP